MATKVGYGGLKSLGLPSLQSFKTLTETSWVRSDASTTLSPNSLHSEAERFWLWAQSMGLTQAGHASLDYRVRDSSVIKDAIFDLLTELNEHLENLTSVLLGHRPPLELQATQETTANESDDDSSLSSLDSSRSFHEADFRLSSITLRLDSLYKLAAKIRNPRNRPQRPTTHLYKHIPESERAQYRETQEQIEIALVAFVQEQSLLNSVTDAQLQELGINRTDLINRYASPTNWLVRRIGIANARRKQQFVYWAKHAEVLAHDATNVAPTPPETTQIITSPSYQHLPGAPAQSMATSATKLTNVNYTGPEDLRSVISHHSRVTTVVSPRGEKLVWPSAPDRLTGSGFFVCPYCRIICPEAYLSRDQWRVHQINDLQPYQCTYEDCSNPHRLYGQRDEWIDHENQHRRVWHCYTHGKEFETQPDYLRHLQEEEHPHEHPSDVQATCVVASSAEPHRDCPLCPSAFSDVTQMREHVRYHLERLALFALPDVEEESEHHISRGGSSEGTKIVERRGSRILLMQTFLKRN